MFIKQSQPSLYLKNEFIAAIWEYHNSSIDGMEISKTSWSGVYAIFQGFWLLGLLFGTSVGWLWGEGFVLG